MLLTRQSRLAGDLDAHRQNANVDVTGVTAGQLSSQVSLVVFGFLCGSLTCTSSIQITYILVTIRGLFCNLHSGGGDNSSVPLKHIHSYPWTVPLSIVGTVLDTHCSFCIRSFWGKGPWFNWRTFVLDYHGNCRSAATAWVQDITECNKWIHWKKFYVGIHKQENV